MAYFREALSAPAFHFKRLRQAEPLFCNGSPIVRRTSSIIETEIMVEGRHFILYLPFHTQSIDHIRAIEEEARNRSRGPLLENYILDEEITMVGSLGNISYLDIVLQELPSGVILKDAVTRYRADDLKAAIRKMKERIDKIGFKHGNLTPSNVIICDSGIARPLRYWYAKWEVYSDNDISNLLDFIDRNSSDELSSALPRLVVQDNEAEYQATPIKHDGIRLICKGHRYGFIDNDERPITRFEFSWASEFKEGRAIVAKNGKMGVINSNGKKVIPVSYQDIKFDITTGYFIATKDGRQYLKNYEGKTIRHIENDSYEINKE